MNINIQYNIHLEKSQPISLAIKQLRLMYWMLRLIFIWCYDLFLATAYLVQFSVKCYPVRGVHTKVVWAY